MPRKKAANTSSIGDYFLTPDEEAERKAGRDRAARTAVGNLAQNDRAAFAAGLREIHGIDLARVEQKHAAYGRNAEKAWQVLCSLCDRFDAEYEDEHSSNTFSADELFIDWGIDVSSIAYRNSPRIGGMPRDLEEELPEPPLRDWLPGSYRHVLEALDRQDDTDEAPQERGEMHTSQKRTKEGRIWREDAIKFVRSLKGERDEKGKELSRHEKCRRAALKLQKMQRYGADFLEVEEGSGEHKKQGCKIVTYLNEINFWDDF